VAESSRPVLAALAAMLVVASALVAGVGSVSGASPGPDVDANADAGVAQSDDEDDSAGNETGLPTADEAYVTEDGDVVLVYSNETDRDAPPRSQVEFGLDVGSGLFYALATGNGTDGNITGEGTALVTPDGLTGNGSLTAPRPSSVRSLSVSATGSTTAENAKADASLSAELDDRNASGAGVVTTASVAGEFRVAPETFSARTDVDAELLTPLGDAQSREFTLTENEDGYRLTAAENYTLSRYAADRWDTRERAVRTIESRYASIAESLGGSAEVTVDSYEYTNTSRGPRLRIDYAVDYEGIDEGLRQQIEAQLLASEEYDLTEAEAETVAEAVANLTVDRASVAFEQEEGTMSGSFRLELSDYGDAVRAAVTVADAVEQPGATGVPNASLERVRKTFEARRASGLVQTYTFSVDVAQPDRGTTGIDGSFAYRTDNWAAYVEELRTRGIETGTSSYEVTARSSGDRILAEASVDVERDEFVRSAVDQLLNASDGSMDPDTRQLLASLRESGFRIARMDVSATDERVRVEAGAAFRNLTALRDALRETGTAPAVTSVVGRSNDRGSVDTYVRVNAGLGANASREEVGDLEPVGEETDVFLPGEYDRTFPSVDIERPRDYLGVTPTPTATPPPTTATGADANGTGGDGEGPTGTSQPGLGFGAALVALVLAVVGTLARRRG